jgi:vitamin K-dependent gamma-carboxylase
MATERAPALARLLALANQPRDPAGLGAFRLVFGAVLVFSVARFVAKGWIAELYLEPRFHFAYDGFAWVRALPPAGMYALFALMGAAALALTLGVRSRAAALIFCASFTYVELIDKTTYLNHYYFVSLLTLLLAFVPSDAWGALGSRARASAAVPAWCYALLRCQVGVVYVFAGLAKLDADWLLRAEPLRTWLGVYADTPGIGGLLIRPELAVAMSWAGAAFDLAIVPLLLWSKSRIPAYIAAIAFHGAVGLLFPIGVFPWLMLAAATLFFPPSWPRRWSARSLGWTETRVLAPLSGAGVAVAALYVAGQVALPLRFLAYPGAVNWTEQGFRFAWRVMLIEKTGQVEYSVVTRAPSARFTIDPRAELTAFQYRMLSTQPDMIHDYALVLAERYRSRGYQGVEVYAEAFAALNGRPSARLIDATTDLAGEPRSLAAKSWILAEPRGERELAARAERQ